MRTDGGIRASSHEFFFNSPEKYGWLILFHGQSAASCAIKVRRHFDWQKASRHTPRPRRANLAALQGMPTQFVAETKRWSVQASFISSKHRCCGTVSSAWSKIDSRSFHHLVIIIICLLQRGGQMLQIIGAAAAVFLTDWASSVCFRTSTSEGWKPFNRCFCADKPVARLPPCRWWAESIIPGLSLHHLRQPDEAHSSCSS